MKRKVLAVLLVFVMLVSMMSSAFAGIVFEDEQEVTKELEPALPEEISEGSVFDKPNTEDFAVGIGISPMSNGGQWFSTDYIDIFETAQVLSVGAADLQEKIDAAVDGEPTIIELTQDYDSSLAIINIPAEKIIKIASEPGEQYEINAGGSHGVILAAGELWLENVKITGGNAHSGGGIYSATSLTLLDGAVVSGNTAAYAGGGISGLGKIDIFGGEISHNEVGEAGTGGHSGDYGGGIYAVNANITLHAGQIVSNTALGDGGGIYLDRGSAIEITGGKISNNTADGLYGGGGICSYNGWSNEFNGITISGGEISGNSAGAGGGIYSWRADIEISNGRIEDNNAESVGGGISAGGGTFEISGGIITGNTVADKDSGWSGGGGIYLRGYDANVEFKMIGGEISGNTAPDGGGLYAEACTVEVAGGKINSNTAQTGGGIYIRGLDDREFKITGGEINGNTANTGGGIFLGQSTVIGTISNCKVNNNTADAGGGIYVSHNIENISISGCEIRNNNARSGAGVYSSCDTLEITGSEISDNDALLMGGGIHASNADITDTIISGNTAAYYGGGIFSWNIDLLTVGEDVVFENNVAWEDKLAQLVIDEDITMYTANIFPGTPRSINPDTGMQFEYLYNNYDIYYPFYFAVSGYVTGLPDNEGVTVDYKFVRHNIDVDNVHEIAAVILDNEEITEENYSLDELVVLLDAEAGGDIFKDIDDVIDYFNVFFGNINIDNIFMFIELFFEVPVEGYSAEEIIVAVNEKMETDFNDIEEILEYSFMMLEGYGNKQGSVTTDASGYYEIITYETISEFLVPFGVTLWITPPAASEGWTLAPESRMLRSVTENEDGQDFVYSEIREDVYTVTYHGNTNTGGTEPIDDNSPYQDNDTVTVLDKGSLVKKGHSFKGWATSSNGAVVYAAGAEFAITENVDLYAVWEQNRPSGGGGSVSETKYTVTFDSNGAASVPSQKIVQDRKAKRPSDPSKAGYKFEGWYLDDELYDFDTKVTENITLIAQWTEVDEEIGELLVLALYKGNIVYEYKINENIGDTVTKRAPNLPGYDLVDENEKTIIIGSGENVLHFEVDKIAGVGGPGGLVLELRDHIKYINGYPEGDVKPDNNITRAEAAAIFYRLLAEQGTAEATFSDVTDDAWYADAVNYLAANGIILGYPDGTFKPNATITRAEFAAIASRFDRLEEVDASSFRDVMGNHWASGYVNSAALKGWVSGFPDGTFKPDEGITRVQVVTVVNKMLDRRIDLEDVPEWVEEFTDLSTSYWGYTEIIEAANEHEYKRTADGSELWLE